MKEATRRGSSTARIPGHTCGNLIAPELMGHVAVHTNGKNSCFIENGRTMCNQSSEQDSALEDEKAKKEDRPSSSYLSTHSGTIQTKKNLAITSLTRGGKLVTTPATGSI